MAYILGVYIERPIDTPTETSPSERDRARYDPEIGQNVPVSNPRISDLPAI